MSEDRLATGSLPPDSAVVVSPHRLASQAGIDAIASGGNAVDAAIAANAVLGVVLPDTCGPGGDLFAIIHRPGDEAPVVLNASGRCGSGASAQALRDQGHRDIPVRSIHSITVPGCVDGWEALTGHAAARTLADNLAPAIGLATEGFPVSKELSASLAFLQPMLGGQPSAAPLYPEGAVPEPGQIVTRPLIAETLGAVAADGRSAFYQGAVGDAIIEVTGGIITPADLERVQVEWVDPLGADVMGLRAWTVPPNSQGWLTLATLRIFEMANPPRDPLDAEYHHTLIEAYRSVVWERPTLTCDPDTAPLHPTALLDEDRLAERAARIDRAGTRPWPATAVAPGGTAYLCTRDHTGMVVSLIQSNFRGIGTGLSAGSTGVWLHDRGEGFDLVPGSPNELWPGRRPMHTLSPTLWTNGSAGALVLGTRGGDQQPQLLAQVAAHHRWAGMCVEDAQVQPRWVIGDLSDPAPTVRVESRFASGTVDGLAARGHSLEEVDAWQVGWGPVSAISEDGEVRGAADPRVSTAAAVFVSPA